MTCIVAIKENNKIYMGADSLGSNGYTKAVRKDKKIFIKNNMIFGFTSSFRMGQILQYSFNIPDQAHREPDFQYLVDKFIPSLIQTYGEKSFLKKSSEQASGGVFLLGFNKNIYKIESDFQVGMTSDMYDSCGSGENFAMGSLHTTKKFELTPKERIKLAIDAASVYSTGVGGPINILELE